MFATINKMNMDNAIKLHTLSDRFFDSSFVKFECRLKYCKIWKDFHCELTSFEMTYGRNYFSTSVNAAPIALHSGGGFNPTMIEIYDDPCGYDDFEYVVRFARAAIKSGGTANMKYATKKILVEVPDYLSFEEKQS